MIQSNQYPFKVIIIGAGLSGSLLANGLLHASIPITVYEREAENAKREGYQIHLGESTLIGMRACLSEAEIASVVRKFGKAGGRKGQASVIRHKDFRLLLDLKAFPDYSKSAPINRKVLRDTLAAPLAKAGVVRYEKKFVRYEIYSAGKTERVNRQLGLSNITEIKTHVNLLVKQDLPTEKLLSLGREFTSGPILCMADNQNFYFSAYVPEKDDKSSFDEFSSCAVGAALPVEIAPPNIEELSAEEKWKFVSKSMSSWAPEYHRALNVVRDQKFHTYAARSSSRPPRDWRKKVRSNDAQGKGHPRVWLMGDAMHAMFPYRGQGGNQSMRDAASALPLLVGLAEKANDNALTDRDVDTACQSFEDEMIPRTFEWVKKSGGKEVIPFDSSKLLTRVLFAIASRLVLLARLWHFVKPRLGFSSYKNLNDAPELQD
ncbi:Monooxygenase FAD-binding protein [Macrophomina phaseolina MS6]|uniref:Monooxygenase FAD-binding protein n=1 Tax=Macrophomina phaseolina (strain MS6) TaxID=1126212 RepID=K2R1X6_MACPH|nr:Monooxygenase FAD-binding protein [Macrophomina phaseolina MS6]